MLASGAECVDLLFGYASYNFDLLWELAVDHRRNRLPILEGQRGKCFRKQIFGLYKSANQAQNTGAWVIETHLGIGAHCADERGDRLRFVLSRHHARLRVGQVEQALGASTCDVEKSSVRPCDELLDEVHGVDPTHTAPQRYLPRELRGRRHTRLAKKVRSVEAQTSRFESSPAGIMTTGHSRPFAAWQVEIVTFYITGEPV